MGTFDKASQSRDGVEVRVGTGFCNGIVATCLYVDRTAGYIIASQAKL